MCKFLGYENENDEFVQKILSSYDLHSCANINVSACSRVQKKSFACHSFRFWVFCHWLPVVFHDMNRQNCALVTKNSDLSRLVFLELCFKVVCICFKSMFSRSCGMSIFRFMDVTIGEPVEPTFSERLLLYIRILEKYSLHVLRYLGSPKKILWLRRL